MGDHSLITCRVYENVCWICGSASELTGEHKIKKTDLERYSVSKPRFQTIDGRVDKPIQGPNSKLLKFNNSICKYCNNTGTQTADRSYDAFMLKEAGVITCESDVERIFTRPEDDRHLNLMGRVELARYFGKHLGCALWYQKFPIPRRLSGFVGGKSAKPCIDVTTRPAPFWWQADDGTIGPLNAIGGAYIRLRNGPNTRPASYHSAYMTGGIQFIVSMRLSVLEAAEIRSFARKSRMISFRAFSEEEAKYRGLPK